MISRLPLAVSGGSMIKSGDGTIIGLMLYGADAQGVVERVNAHDELVEALRQIALGMNDAGLDLSRHEMMALASSMLDRAHL